MAMFNREKPLETPSAAPMKDVAKEADTHARTPETPAAQVQILSRPPEQTSVARPRPASEPSRISGALKITGQLESDEDIQIDGHVEGDIRARRVIIGAGATINGNIFGDDVELSGTVNGKIDAASVVLSKTARMSGDVVHKALQIDKGAFIDGHCRPQDQAAAALQAQDKKRNGL